MKRTTRWSKKLYDREEDGTLTDYIVVSYPDPCFHSSGSITSPLRDVIHPQLWESGSGYETRIVACLSFFMHGIRVRLYCTTMMHGVEIFRDNFLRCEVSFCSGCDRLNSFEREMIMIHVYIMSLIEQYVCSYVCSW